MLPHITNKSNVQTPRAVCYQISWLILLRVQYIIWVVWVF